eukprot:g60541.t1
MPILPPRYESQGGSSHSQLEPFKISSLKVPLIQPAGAYPSFFFKDFLYVLGERCELPVTGQKNKEVMVQLLGAVFVQTQAELRAIPFEIFGAC